MLTASFLHYSTAHQDAIPASERLGAAILRLTGRSVGSQQVADLVVTCIHRAEFEIARIWRGAVPGPDWWEIRFDSAAVAVRERHDLCNFADSEHSALAFVSYELRVAGLAEHACSRSGAGWVFTAGASTLCEVRRPRFEVASSAHEARVAKVLEGIRAYGDEGRMLSRLSALPGLENLRLIGLPSVHSSATGSTVVLSPGGMAKCLRSNVKDMLGVDLSQGASQECLAVLYGFRDWNELVALANRAGDVWRPVTVGAWDNEGGVAWVRHYRNQMQAIWAFGTKMREADGPAFAELHGFSTFTDCVTLYAVGQERSSVLEDADELFVCSGWPLVDAPDDEVAGDFARQALERTAG